MLSLPASVRVFVARDRVDFRKGFDGLHGLVRDEFGEDALSGNVFVFFNARRDRVKLLVWDRNGFWLLCKRLERGTFQRIDGTSVKIEIDRARLAMLLDGIDTRNSGFYRYSVRDVRIAARGDDARARAGR
jgi:transposase